MCHYRLHGGMSSHAQGNFQASKGLTGGRATGAPLDLLVPMGHPGPARTPDKGIHAPVGRGPRVARFYVPARLGQCATQLRADRAELDPLTTIPNVVDSPAAIEPS
jgi:hypothetical protein